MLIEQTSVPVSALPVAEFKDHLRLGAGFADGALQDAVLETCLRAAISSIEARTGKALIVAHSIRPPRAAECRFDFKKDRGCQQDPARRPTRAEACSIQIIDVAGGCLDPYPREAKSNSVQPKG